MTAAPSQLLGINVAKPVLEGKVLDEQLIIAFGGHTITGGVLSFVVMVWTQEEVFPHASVAVQVRVMIGSTEHGPDIVTSAKAMFATVPQASVAVACPVVDGPVFEPHSMVIFGGQVTTGPVLSSTTMICVQVAVLPQSSVAVQVRVMVFSPRHAPGDSWFV